MLSRIPSSAVVALVLVAFAAVGILLVVNIGGQVETDPPPFTTFSPRKPGSKALFELLAAGGVKAVRYHGNEYNYPLDGCMVAIIETYDPETMWLGPALNPVGLRLWLAEGGRLVLLAEDNHEWVRDLVAELNDADSGTDPPGATPLRADIPSTRMAEYEAKGEKGSDTAIWDVYAPGEVYALAEERPLLWQNVRELELSVRSWEDPLPAEVLLAVKRRYEQEPTPVVYHQRHGEGELVLITEPELAANGWIGRADNHRLLLNLIHYARRGGPVHFDEYIHGYRRPSRSPLAILLHTPGGQLILALWGAVLLLLLGRAIPAARIREEQVTQRRQSAEMVYAQAGLYQRAGVTGNTARALVDGLKRSVLPRQSRRSLPPDSALSQWLAGLPETSDTTWARRTLAAYLEQAPDQLSRSDLLALAQACDKLRALQTGSR